VPHLEQNMLTFLCQSNVERLLTLTRIWRTDEGTRPGDLARPLYSYRLNEDCA